MGFLTAPQVRRVDLGNGYWADVTEIAAGAYSKVQQHMTHTSIATDQPDVQLDLPAFRIELVVACLSDWNLTDENDGPLPLQPERLRRTSVSRLPPWAFEKIRKAADELNGERRDHGQFRDGGAEGDPDGDGWPGSPAEVPDVPAPVAATGPEPV